MKDVLSLFCFLFAVICGMLIDDECAFNYFYRPSDSTFHENITQTSPNDFAFFPFGNENEKKLNGGSLLGDTENREIVDCIYQLFDHLRCNVEILVDEIVIFSFLSIYRDRPFDDFFLLHGICFVTVCLSVEWTSHEWSIHQFDKCDLPGA